MELVKRITVKVTDEWLQDQKKVLEILNCKPTKLHRRALEWFWLQEDYTIPSKYLIKKTSHPDFTVKPYNQAAYLDKKDQMIISQIMNDIKEKQHIETTVSLIVFIAVMKHNKMVLAKGDTTDEG